MTIYPEVAWYRIHADWAATSMNIDIRSLEYLEESYYKSKYEEKHISLDHISHLSDDIIPLVHDEYLVIRKKSYVMEMTTKIKIEQIF